MNDEDMETIVHDVRRTVRDTSMVRQVTSGEVRDLCMRMANVGYVPTKASVKAAEMFLAGYNLHLRGKVGTGKSAFFKALSETSSASGARRSFAVIPMGNIDGIHMEEIRQFLSDHEEDELVIDDLGSEAMTNDYGKPVWAIGMILSMREYSPARTHVTSNVNDDCLRSQYGERIFSRMNRFMSVEFLDADRRNPVDAWRMTKTPSLYYHVLGKVRQKASTFMDGESAALERDMKATRPWD